MSGFFYYLPGSQSPKLADAINAGLGYAFPSFAARGCMSGPDGDIGAVCGVTSEQLGYFANRQTWRRIPGSSAWVGYYTDAPPTPEDLARTEQIDGHKVKLCDGRYWLCPIARGPEGVVLPRYADLDDEGHWTAGRVQPQHEAFLRIAEEFWCVFAGGEANDDGIVFNFDGLNESAVGCLAVNYRLGPIEAAILQLFDLPGKLVDARAMKVLEAAVDWPKWQSLVKKKLVTEGTSPIDVGQADDCQTTGLATSI